MPINDGELGKKIGDVQPKPAGEESPGYETTDVNVNGVVVFLSGLMGFLVIFFVFCFFMGKVINTALQMQDGPKDKWHSFNAFAGAAATGGKRQDLESNATMEQKELGQMTSNFPTPRLDIDDGNQATADLHAREDLLLNHYSSYNGTTRIPIDRAMELIAEKGLPVAPQSTAGANTGTELMAGDARPLPMMPLTTGFARTGYELDAMEARKQKMSYSNAEGATHAELAPIK
jgi:hypothetical protein